MTDGRCGEVSEADALRVPAWLGRLTATEGEVRMAGARITARWCLTMPR